MAPRAILLATLFALTALAGCTSDPPAAGGTPGSCLNVERAGLGLADANHSVVALDTRHGCIVAELYDDVVPITVDNFLAYVNDGFYEDMLFHRIIKDFMIQTGGMEADGTMKRGNHPAIKNEAKASGLKNLAYTLSMARTNAPDSATNQFFINTANNANLDAGGFSPDGYAVFGNVVQGRDVVDAIENTPTSSYKQGKHCQQDSSPSCPNEDVQLFSVKLLA